MYEFENDFPLVIYNDGHKLVGVKQVIDKLNELESKKEDLEECLWILSILKDIHYDNIEEHGSYSSDLIYELLEMDKNKLEDFWYNYCGRMNPDKDLKEKYGDWRAVE